MGAYENPQEVVDTKSGQIWANAITSVGNSFVQGVISANKKRASLDKAQAEQDNWTFDYALNKQSKMFDSLSKAGVNNPSLLAMTTDLLSKNAEAVKREKYGRTAEEKRQGAIDAGKYQSHLASIVPLFNGIKEGRSDFTENFNPTKNGEQGSLGFFGKNNQQMQKIFSIETTVNPGDADWSFNDEGINITYSGERMDKPVTMKAAEVANYTFQLVPFSDKTTSNLLKPSSKENPKGLDITGSNGNLTDQYLDNDRAELIISDSGELQTIKIPADYQAIAGAMNNSLQTEATSILGDYEMANSIWQNTMGNTTPLKSGSDGAGSIDADDAIKFTNAWKERAGGLIPNSAYIDINGPEGPAFIEKNPGFLEQQGIVLDPETKKYKRDINRDGIGDKDIDNGRVYATDVKGKEKTSVRKSDDPTEGEIKRGKTSKRLNNLVTKMEGLNTARPTNRFSKKRQDILPDAELAKALSPEFTFKKVTGDNDSNYVTIGSVATGKSAEIPTKGLNDAKLKMLMYILDGGTTSDPDYKKLTKENTIETKVDGLPIVFNPFKYFNE